jgi:hypothetical protein
VTNINSAKHSGTAKKRIAANKSKKRVNLYTPFFGINSFRKLIGRELK